MSLKATILDGNGDGREAIVTEFGQLVVGPIDYSSASVQTMDVVDTGYMYIPPIQGKRIVITQIVLYANKNVSSLTEADIEIYESTLAIGITVETSILQIGMLKQTTNIIPMNYITQEGVWVMGKTSDDDIKASIYYYYIPVD